MRYFGKRSVSSIMSLLIHVAWWAVLVATILAPFFMAGILFLSTPQGDAWRDSVSRGATPCLAGERIEARDLSPDFSPKDQQDWERFKQTPLPLRLLLVPYGIGFFVLLLFILQTAHRLFRNFTEEILFREVNVRLMSRLAKLTIGFSVLTFSGSSFLLSITLLLGCEIIRNGTALQEEHDLTV